MPKLRDSLSKTQRDLMKKIQFLVGILVISMVAILSSCDQAPVKEAPQEEMNPLLGAWEMNSVYWISKDTTYAIEKTQPGIFMFTPKRYSIMWTPTEAPRVPFADLSAPTDEELIAGFRSVVFNAGTYEFSDSTVTATAKIAKVPGFEGGKQFYRYQISENKLELIMFDETYPDGKKPGWAGKYETKFVMTKAE